VSSAAKARGVFSPAARAAGGPVGVFSPSGRAGTL
jgi:hypothetical protein